MSRNPTLNADCYKLIGRCLGRMLAYIQQEHGVPTEPMAFRVTVDGLIREFELDNPKFDARRFRHSIEAARLGEYDGDSNKLATAGTSSRTVSTEDHDVQTDKQTR